MTLAILAPYSKPYFSQIALYMPYYLLFGAAPRADEKAMNEAYRAGLQTLYDGEVMGERLLLALHAAARSPREADHFAAILQLETETKARLRPLLLKYGMSLAETADLGGIPGRLATYASDSWRDYTAATARRLTAVLRIYEHIAALGPPEDQPILQAVVRHEAALIDWARAEAEGETDQSLAAIVDLLCYPPAATVRG